MLIVWIGGSDYVLGGGWWVKESVWRIAFWNQLDFGNGHHARDSQTEASIEESENRRAAEECGASLEHEMGRWWCQRRQWPLRRHRQSSQTHQEVPAIRKAIPDSGPLQRGHRSDRHFDSHLCHHWIDWETAARLGSIAKVGHWRLNSGRLSVLQEAKSVSVWGCKEDEGAEMEHGQETDLVQFHIRLHREMDQEELHWLGALQQRWLQWVKRRVHRL